MSEAQEFINLDQLENGVPEMPLTAGTRK